MPRCVVDISFRQPYQSDRPREVRSIYHEGSSGRPRPFFFLLVPTASCILISWGTCFFFCFFSPKARRQPGNPTGTCILLLLAAT